MRYIETRTDANGQYVLSNVRAGQVQVTAWEPGSGHRNTDRLVEVEENETCVADFNFEMYEGGVEGYVFMNGAACPHAYVQAESSETGEGRLVTGATSDQQGYYRVSNLAPGTYALRVQNLLSDSRGSRVMMEASVEVVDGEITRYDFVQESGSIEGVVLGLREGEKAGVALFEEWIDPAAILSLSMEAFEERMLISTEARPGEMFGFGDVPEGAYYLGVIALPGGEETAEWNIGDSLAQGRFAAQLVEVTSGEVTTVEVVIP